MATFEDYAELGEEWYVEKIPRPNRFIYIDNGADILAVAHLDTVQDTDHFYHLPKLDRIYNAQLDDRLGAYVILDLLPAMGIKLDVLFTEGEEEGKSTAAYFEPPEDKKYKWIVEFDRKGDDVVMYDYMDRASDDLLRKVGYPQGAYRGSFTDICKLYDMKVKGFNWGVGYHDNHSRYGYLEVEELVEQMQKFHMFYGLYKDTHLPHEKKVVSYTPPKVNHYRGGAYSYLSYGAMYDEDGAYIYTGADEPKKYTPSWEHDQCMLCMTDDCDGEEMCTWCNAMTCLNSGGNILDDDTMLCEECTALWMEMAAAENAEIKADIGEADEARPVLL